MAKNCINCGKQLNLLEKGNVLQFTGVCFCNACFSKATELLIPVQKNVEFSLSTDADYFENHLQESVLNNVSRSAVRNEFEELVLAKFTGKTLVKSFDADFDTSYKAIQKACAEFSNTEAAAEILEMNGVKTAVFSVERYPIGVYRYFTLIVQLVSCDGMNVVSTQVSNSMYGDLRSAHRKFWSIFEEQNPDIHVTAVYK